VGQPASSVGRKITLPQRRPTTHEARRGVRPQPVDVDVFFSSFFSAKVNVYALDFSPLRAGRQATLSTTSRLCLVYSF